MTLQLDLEGVVTSYSEPAPLIGFLNRRRVAWIPTAHPRHLLVSTLRSVIRQHHSVHVMREVFSMLHYDGSETVYPPNADKITPAALKLQTPMLKSKEVIADVFKFLLSEDVVEPDHLEMCLMEFMRSVDRKKLSLDPSAYVVWTDVLIRQKKFFQVRAFCRTAWMTDGPYGCSVTAAVEWMQRCTDRRGGSALGESEPSRDIS